MTGEKREKKFLAMPTKQDLGTSQDFFQNSDENPSFFTWEYPQLQITQ